MEAVGSSDGQSYNVIPRVMGNEMVCLRAVEINAVRKLGDFLVPDSIQKNERAIHYEVVKIGSDVTDICGVRVGDFVLVDALARFADTEPISFINCRNILFKTDKSGKEKIALKYNIITRIIEPSQETISDESGFITLSNINPYAVVVSIGEGCEDRGYKLGDKLSVCSGATMIMCGNDKYFIYDYRSPMFKFV